MPRILPVGVLLLAFAALAAPPLRAADAAPFAPQILDSKAPASERADDFEAALARAQATGKDILVYQYGSDWNPASLAIFQNAWSKDALTKALGDGFVLVAVDHPEVAGGRAVYGRCTAEKCGLTGFSDQPIGSSAPLRLEALAKAEPPPSEVAGVTSEGGVVFAKRADGAFVVDGGSVPNADTFTLQLKVARAGRAVRVDFPALSPQQAGFAGLAFNGNFCLSGAAVNHRGRPLAIRSAKSDKWEGEFTPANLIKPASDASSHEWNASAHTGGARTLWLELDDAVPAGAELTLRLDAKTRWGQHVPAAVRAAVVDALPADPAKPGAAPASQVTAVASEQGLPFAKAADGSFVARIAKNPPQDTLVLTLKPARAGAVLRLDFPTDPSLPNGGPGRTGNAVIGEVEVRQGDRQIAPQFAWGSRNGGNNFGPWTTVDGKSDDVNAGWNLYGGERQPRTLLLALKEPLAAGKEVTVRLVCKTQWNHHVPGCVRAALLSDAQTLEDVRAVAKAQVLQYRNRQCTFGIWGKMPQLSLLDANNRPVAVDVSLPIGLTAEQIAAQAKAWRTLRQQRDALWAEAEKAEGPAKAELLRRSLDTMGFGRDRSFGMHNGWGGGNGPYGFVHARMKEADPKDESGAVRWLGFSQGAWGGLPWAPENQWWKKLEGKNPPTETDFAEAEACINRELADPRNRLLEKDHIQHIMKAKYDLYRRMGKDNQDDKILDLQRQIAKVDPDTFWGVGAIGYLGMYRRSDQPFITYGFSAKHQVKAGVHAWTLADAWKEIDHAGAYKLTIAYQGGKDALRIVRAAPVLDGKELGAGSPAAGMDILDPTRRSVQIPFDCAAFPAGAKVGLKVEYEAKEGTEDLIGWFTVEPVLVEE